MRKLSILIFLTGLALVLGAALVQGGLAVFNGAGSVPDNTFTTIPCFPNANIGFRDPSAEGADTGGDGDGFELNPTNAFADDANFASNINNQGAEGGDRHRFYDYGIAIPTGCAVAGIQVRLDWWLDNLAGIQSMSVELSWDGGFSWTAAKTDTVETTTEHTALLGGPPDTWGRSWTPAELGNANFRVRLTSNSTNNLRDFFLDWVPVNVYYALPAASPTSTPAPTDTPTPGPSPTPTNTPTPGPSPTPTVTSTPGPTFTPTVTPTPCPAGDTGLLDAAGQAADTGGDGDGFELNPTNAFADDANFASNINNQGAEGGDRHRFYDYGIVIPAGCAVAGIEVRLDWWLDNRAGTQSMSVELSWDGGSSWTAAKTDPVETTTEHTALLGGPTDTWGRSWTPAELGDASFRVRLTSNSTNNNRDFFLDWVPVRVYYGP